MSQNNVVRAFSFSFMNPALSSTPQVAHSVTDSGGFTRGSRRGWGLGNVYDGDWAQIARPDAKPSVGLHAIHLVGQAAILRRARQCQLLGLFSPVRSIVTDAAHRMQSHES